MEDGTEGKPEDHTSLSNDTRSKRSVHSMQETLAEADINKDELSPEELKALFDKNTESFRCLAQILISRSSLYCHPLYQFDYPTDPGIEAAFEYIPPETVKDGTGCNTYKANCKEMDIVPISRILKSLPTSTLDLRYYGLSSKQIKALTNALIFNNHVKELILEENAMNPEALSYISEMLQDNNNIAFLSLKNCFIGSQGCKRLSEGIFTTQSLKELDLSHNEIGSDGLLPLLNSIRANMSIKKLVLSHNQLTEEVSQRLGKALAENDCLENLDISWNNINGLHGLKYLCEGLTTQNRIKVLNLAWNGISTTDAFIHVFRFLKNTTTLEHIDLSNNQMQGDLLKKVRSAILANSTLISIDLSSNIITPDEASILAHVFTDKRAATEPLQLKYLKMENVFVNKFFLPYWRKLTRSGKFVKFEGVLSNYAIAGPDVKKVLFDRLRYVAQNTKKKKSRKEFGHFLYNFDKQPGKQKGDKRAPIPIPVPTDEKSELSREPDGIVKTDFMDSLKKFKIQKVYKDGDLLKELLKSYVVKKDKVNINLMRDEYYKYYPETTIPEVKKKKKDKKKKKSKQGDGAQVKARSSVFIHENPVTDEIFDDERLSQASHQLRTHSLVQSSKSVGADLGGDNDLIELHIGDTIKSKKSVEAFSSRQMLK